MLQIDENQGYKMCFLSWLTKDSGEKEYAFALVSTDALPILKQKIESLEEYSLQDYAVVVERGIGTPTQAVVERVNKEFKTDFAY